MKNKSLDIAGFLKLVIEALNAAGVEYLIGGAIAAWAWGEPRATQDLDLVVKIPIKSVNKLSKKLEKRDMLIPAEIIPRTSWKTGQISQSMPSTCTAGSKLIYIQCGRGMSFDKVPSNAVNKWTTVHQSERCISIPQRISFFISSYTLGSGSNRNIPATSPQFSSQRKMNSTWTILADGQLD
ncbi:MAG TPA: hypothetical protein VIR02_21525 [Anaerolineales bacterium]